MVDKILFITEKEEHDENLMKCLRSLFPECQIEIHLKHSDVDYHLSPSDEPASERKLDKRLKELLNRL